MSTFTFVSILVCFQACFMQSVFGQCNAGWSLSSAANNAGCGHGLGYNLGSSGYGWNGAEVAGAYGGTGTGDLDVAGELPVVGTTLVAGQVPILGAVQFAGEVPAGGVVSIFGKCGCDCNGGPLLY
ncbi:unnamed protein product, partial [Iphiclides podalirius]